ncbi:class I SAM-dependent methyltransferase [bacterium]|nr:class I SAM-dependent methyltransferase [bacterium]
MSTRDHYEKHLADYYSWMFGDFEKKLDDNRRFFSKHDIHPFQTKLAYDLGAGCGYQSIPLAEAGFNVKAVDFSKKLLSELESYRGNLTIESIESDMMRFDDYATQQADLFVCMGDTLTHLESENDVKTLFRNVFGKLTQGGWLVLTYRDLTFELTDIGRFIPVRGTAERTFTCFLEYFSDHVQVFDIVNELQDGQWQQKISSYKKIKIAKNDSLKLIRETGFAIEYQDIVRGMVTIVAKK